MIGSNINSQEILLELKRTNKLLALMVTQNRSQADKILLLSQVGLSPKEVSEILGVSSNLVSVTIHQNKKKIKKRA